MSDESVIVRDRARFFWQVRRWSKPRRASEVTPMTWVVQAYASVASSIILREDDAHALGIARGIVAHSESRASKSRSVEPSPSRCYDPT